MLERSVLRLAISICEGCPPFDQHVRAGMLGVGRWCSSMSVSVGNTGVHLHSR